MLQETVGAFGARVERRARYREHFAACLDRTLTDAQQQALRDGVLKAYRGQYIVSGAGEPRFGEVLKALTTEAQMQRIGHALAPIAAHVGA